jgi:ATP-dependent RNA helicase DHX57
MPNKQRKAEKAASSINSSAATSQSAMLSASSTASRSVSQDKRGAKTGAKPEPRGKKPEQPEDEGSKKPDTRSLISGSASWTGKLPMNLLAEHCQKQRWEKPDYGMRKLPDNAGFLSWVTLRSKHPKTQVITELKPFRIPSAHEHLLVRSTAAEARHLAAIYALFRVASAKNLHHMLPPTMRDVWKELQSIKDTDVRDNKGWLYEADPFQAQKEREAAAEAAKKAREAREQQAAAAASSSGGALGNLPHRGGPSGAWKYATPVDLGLRRRTEVEAVVRKYVTWNVHGNMIPPVKQKAIVERLTDYGFRKKHAEEAVEQCMNEEEAMEWLLIHVPEDDLPQWSFPEGYTAGINLASSNLVREASIKRLHEAGYPTDLCSTALDAHDGDEHAAGEVLQKTLEDTIADSAEDTSIDDTWLEEMDVLTATFGDNFEIPAPKTCQVSIELDQTKLDLRIAKSQAYPNSPPVISLHGKLPAHIKLSVYRQLLRYCHEILLGQPMVFSIIDWIEENGKRIIDNPDRLQDVAGALTGVSQPFDSTHRRRTSKTTGRKARTAPSKLSNTQLLQAQQSTQQTSGYQKVLSTRQRLPAWQLRQEIVRTVQENQVTIISGETGSGKSTQAVQFLLDEMIQAQRGASVNILCTQPRRISALSLAQRVSDERCDEVGQEIGFAIRGEAKHTPGITKITFLTTGVLLRRLQSAESYVEALTGVSHVVVDEVHERDLDTDFLLILLRNILSKRGDLKVLLMSATLDAEIFEGYFRQKASIGKIDIPGRTFPVTDHYLDEVVEASSFSDGVSRDTKDIIQRLAFRVNYDLILATVTAICERLKGQDGGILIFLPGVAEINRLIDTLKRLPNIVAFPLHASLTSAEQRRVFHPVKHGQRKVIAATNVAETSITIDDVVAVIDTGKVKQTSFDAQSNMVKLQETMVSQAAAKQRRGRAGRTRAGDCYKLYTSEAESKMTARTEPEIVRVPLEQLYLSVRAMGVTDVQSFLKSALTPPKETAVEGAKEQLLAMGAFDGNNLTPLGYHISRIPADIRLAKLMIYGVLFACLDRCVTIASILTSRSPFLSPKENREQAKQARVRFATDQGDLIADMRAYEAWKEKLGSTPNAHQKQWCFENFLSDQTLRDISSNRAQYKSALQETGFLNPAHRRDSPEATALNVNGNNLELLRAVIAGAFYPQVARIQLPNKKYTETVSGTVELDPEARTIKYFLKDAGRVFVHPSSTLFDAQGFVNNSLYMAYFAKMATAKTFIRDLTPFTTYGLLFFGGKITLDARERGLVVDDWLRLRGWPRIGVLVSRLRAILDNMLENRIDDPGASGGSEQSNEVLSAVTGLLEYNGLDR